MSGLSIAAACLASITFYVGFYHLLIYLQSRQRREDFAFALACLSIGFYDVFCAGLYSTRSPETGAFWQHWQFIALAGAGGFLIWFTSEFIGRKNRRLDYFFYAYWVIQIGLLVIGHNHALRSEVPAEKAFTLFGMAVFYHEVRPGILENIQGVIGLLACLYILNSLVTFYRAGKRVESGPIIVGLFFLVVGVINDSLVSSGIYQSIYLIEYGYLCLVLAMAYSLTRGHLRTQAALRVSEERYRALINSVPDIIYTVDPSGVILSINDACFGLFGYRQDEMINRSFLQYVHPDDVATAREAFYSAVVTKHAAEPGTLSLRIVRKDGSARWISLNGNVTLGERGQILHLQGVMRDVTESRKAEDNLARLAAAVNAAAESIIVTDTMGTIQYVNPCFEQMTGYTREEMIGKNPRILNSGKHDKAFYSGLWTTISSGDTWHGHFMNRRKSGTLFEEEAVISPVRDASGRIVNYVAVKRDVTQQRLLENQLRHSQTMEAIGRLAKGVAHDFTNMLVVITNSVHLAQKRLAPVSPEIQHHFDNIMTASNRAADLTGQLLAFSHQQSISVRDIDLSKSVHGIEEMISRTLEQNVRLTIRTSTEPTIVKVDPGQLEQVIVHLVVNASDAMPGGGQLTLETSHRVLSETEATQIGEGARRVAGAAGSFAVLTVSDSGTGMSPEAQAHVFEPFFTTKEKGKSTGLGLSTVYGIVHQHGGFVTVYSIPGTGTTFAIYLPRINAAEAAARSMDLPTRVRHSETVLLLEEDPLSRSVLARILQERGYTVLEAENAKLGLNLAQTDRKIDLLMCDFLLAGTDGRKFAANLKRIHPESRVVFLSGYPATHLREQGLLKEDEPLITKPFAAGEVKPVVEAVLAG